MTDTSINKEQSNKKIDKQLCMLNVLLSVPSINTEAPDLKLKLQSYITSYEKIKKCNDYKGLEATFAEWMLPNQDLKYSIETPLCDHYMTIVDELLTMYKPTSPEANCKSTTTNSVTQSIKELAIKESTFDPDNNSTQSKHKV